MPLAQLLLGSGEEQSHAPFMISPPTVVFPDRSLPPQSGRAPRSAEVTSARDFTDLVNRLFLSSIPVAALARPGEIPDTTALPPAADRIERSRATETAGASEPADAEAAQEPETVSTSEPTESPPTETSDASALGGWPPREPGVTPSTPPSPPPRAQQWTAPGLVTASAQPAGERALANGAPPFVQANDAEALQAPSQQTRQAVAGTGDLPRIQVLDGSSKDQLPQFGHMLSGRAAVLAQSGDGGSTALPKDATAGVKNGLAEQPASSLFGGAAQASALAAQKSKGQHKPANPAGGGQKSGEAQSAQASTPQPQQNVTAPAALQPGVNNGFVAASAGSGQPGILTPQAARGEPIPMAAPGGQLAPHANFRSSASAPASPRMPVPARFITDQVAVQIQKSLGQGNDRISIQLKPAELGKVEVRIDVGHEGRVTAVITADRADTLDLLQRDARILQSSLQDAGLRTDSNSLSFELRGQGQNFDHAQDRTGGTRGPADAGIDNAAAPDAGARMARPGIVTSDRVDIHV